MRWVSTVLADSGTSVTSLTDFKSGVLLIRLAEQLFHDRVDPKRYRAEPKRDLDMILNCDCAVDFIKSKGVSLVNVCGRDVFDLNPGLFTGLLTTLFFKCQTKAPSPPASGRGDPLLSWVQSFLNPRDIKVVNWSQSWADGLALYALIAAVRPATLDFLAGASLSPMARERKAMDAITQLGIPLYLSAGDIADSVPPATVVKMQVQEIYTAVGADATPPPPKKPLIPPPLPRAEAHLPPEGRTKHSLGIDLGSAKVRFGVFSRDDMSSAFETNVIDTVVSVTESGDMVTGEPDGSIAIPPTSRMIGRQFKDPAVESHVASFPMRVFEHPSSHTCAIDVGYSGRNDSSNLRYDQEGG
jgi:hypothetical protein